MEQKRDRTTLSQAMGLAGRGHRRRTGAAWWAWSRRAAGLAARWRCRVACRDRRARAAWYSCCACAAALESAAVPPLAFTIEHPANRLTAGGAAVACLVAARLRGRFMAPWPVAQRSRRKNFCCVTTRRRNFRRLRWLRRRCGTLTAHAFGLGVLGFGRLVLAPLGLPLRRLPAPHQPQAFGILAVMLVPTPRLVLASTAFAQADAAVRGRRQRQFGLS